MAVAGFLSVEVEALGLLQGPHDFHLSKHKPLSLDILGLSLVGCSSHDYSGHLSRRLGGLPSLPWLFQVASCCRVWMKERKDFRVSRCQGWPPVPESRGWAVEAPHTAGENPGPTDSLIAVSVVEKPLVSV